MLCIKIDVLLPNFVLLFLCVSSLRIHFPDPHSRYRSSQITIIGGLENVFGARHKIMVREREGGREGGREGEYKRRRRRRINTLLFLLLIIFIYFFSGLFACRHFV